MGFWDSFDAVCAAQNNALDRAIETRAVSSLEAEITEGHIQSETFTRVFMAASSFRSWEVIVGALQTAPMMLQLENDTRFYAECPKPLLEKFLMESETCGLLPKFFGHVQSVSEIDPMCIRMMHMIVDTLLVAGQKNRARQMVKMFVGICEQKGGAPGRLPSSLYRKLVEKGVLEQKFYTPNDNHATNNPPKATEPRKVKHPHPHRVVREEDPEVEEALQAARNGQIPGVTLTVAVQ